MKSSNATKIGHAVWVLAGLMLGGLFGKVGTSPAAEYIWAQKADNGLYIGCGSNSTAGSFFSGLIDDVRIYNRAVRP